MPNDTNAGGWPDPERPGVPTLPEVDAFHWLWKRNGAWPEAWLWQSDADGCGTEYSGAWAESDGDGQPETMARWFSYLGPCHTPQEVATIRAEAYAAGLREAVNIADAVSQRANHNRMRAVEDCHTSEIHHQEGRWHAANDIGEDIAILAAKPTTTTGET